MVDYSKWDKMKYDSDDDVEEGEENQPPKKLKVTTLKEKGGKVTIGPQGYSIHEEELEQEEASSLPSFKDVHETILENERKKRSELDDVDEDLVDDELALEDPQAEEVEKQFYEEQKQLYYKQQLEKEEKWKQSEQQQSNETNESPRVIEFVKSSSRKIDPQLRTKNGNHGIYQDFQYEWSQNRYEVTLYLYCSPQLLNVKVNNISEVDRKVLRKRDFHLDYSEETRILTLSYRHRPLIGKEDLFPLLKGKLQYEIQITGDVDNPYDDILDWDVTSMNSSELNTISSPSSDEIPILAFEIVLKKQQKFTNAIIWWKTIFEGEPEIDLTKITERSKNYAEFMNNFQIANQQFLEKVKHLDKVEI